MFLEMKVFGLVIDPFTNSPIVILKDTDNKNTLPIWIGPLEASAIATELEKIPVARPMTHDLLKEILKSLDVIVSKIEVNDLRDNIYYATIHLAMNNIHYAIDARPSDAIALALRTNSSIFVAEKVLEKSRNIDLRKDNEGESQKWLDILENLSPEDFGKYKM